MNKMAEEIRLANNAIMINLAAAKEAREQNDIGEFYAEIKDAMYRVLVLVTRLSTDQHPDLKSPDWTPLFPLLEVTALLIGKVYEESKLLNAHASMMSDAQRVVLSCACLLFKVSKMVVGGILPTTTQEERVAAYEKYKNKIYPRFKPQFDQVKDIMTGEYNAELLEAMNNNMEYYTICLHSLAKNGTIREVRIYCRERQILQELNAPKKRG
jgi:hypothetical protein